MNKNTQRTEQYVGEDMDITDQTSSTISPAMLIVGKTIASITILPMMLVTAFTVDILLTIHIVAINAFTFMKMWNWFVSPLTNITMNYAYALGLIYFIHYITSKFPVKQAESNDVLTNFVQKKLTKISNDTIIALGQCISYLFIGSIIHNQLSNINLMFQAVNNYF
jgi:hypothetical protein